MTDAPIRLGIVGLGAMGRRMLAEAVTHPDFALTHAVDLNPAAVAAAWETVESGVSFSTKVEDVIGADSVDAVYVATPPATHAALVVPAFEAGQAVFCEKPLAVSAADGEAMVAAAQASGRATAVNFALSNQPATQYLEQAIADGRAGDVLAVEIRFAFAEWPRKFQAEATWLAGREQGGFLREVFSHFAYLTDRLLGPLDPIHVAVDHHDPTSSETTACGLLRAGKIPVHLTGIAGAAGPTTYEWTLRGSKQSYRLTNWTALSVAHGNSWASLDLPAPASESTRLALFAQAIHGSPTPDLATFPTAHRIQHVVESFHQGVRSTAYGSEGSSDSI
ncbi:Gfo/Idh/MocA family protein [Kribbella sp. VKM Ac-2568]|uniref:Gfo/Idh/MocA family protein n=1 Tax=Kribbella sp. VKM Ac-2568 TaxID=2512219 RepID=UPI00104A8F68|nr:Gfo/Idh/MocA family oxidoreductase [Kribbella sp. VKM Ac-2568]